MIKNGHFQELFSIRGLSRRIAFYKGVAHSYIDEIKNLLDSRDFYCYHDIQKALKDEFGLTPSLSAIRYTVSDISGVSRQPPYTLLGYLHPNQRRRYNNERY